MLHYPKDYVEEELETVILIAQKMQINVDTIQSRVRAKKRIFLTVEGSNTSKRTLFFFDKVIRLKKVDNFEEAFNLLKPYITNPKLTRIALINCYSTNLAA